MRAARPGALLPAVLLLLALLPGICPSPAEAARGPAKLTLAFTNDVQGYIEPCG